uniref:Uncharacterized protein n=1 Tax=Steinernema glaseri TaxID=37863 RepID=A0A1I7Z007_9BILA
MLADLPWIVAVFESQLELYCALDTSPLPTGKAGERRSEATRNRKRRNFVYLHIFLNNWERTVEVLSASSSSNQFGFTKGPSSPEVNKCWFNKSLEEVPPVSLTWIEELIFDFVLWPFGVGDLLGMLVSVFDICPMQMPALHPHILCSGFASLS